MAKQAMKLRERVEAKDTATAPRPASGARRQTAGASATGDASATPTTFNTVERAQPRAQSGNVAAARAGKVGTLGHFSPELSLALKQLGLNLGGRTLQSLMGEAFDLLFEKHGMPPFGER